MNDDASLLRRFVQQHANDAFAELVRRHLNLVYFAALRQTHGDTHRAEDAAQSTFTFLAQKAGSLLAHPNLAGWLHTVACHHARDLNRAEHRRLQREQTAAIMHELTSAETNDETWTQVRPVIDDALQDLTPEDREAVLLRYFENRPFAAIGAELQIGENAARMRVTRALGQLETALARRGVKSTSAALATVLAIPAAMAAPAGLAHTLSATALTATTVAGTSATVLTVFKIMSSAKLIATATTIAALAAIGTALYQNQQLQASLADADALRGQQAAFQTQLDSLKSQLATEKKRAFDADEDNGRLLAVLAASRPSEIKAATPTTLTYEMVNTRYKGAQTLAKNGNHEEALKEFLWCYDVGMPRFSRFSSVRGIELAKEIAALGKAFPPALAALRERRDAAEKRIAASAEDREAVSDYNSLNRVLGEEAKSLALFDSLPAGDARRQSLGILVSDQLLATQRYADFVQAMPYSTMMGLSAMLIDSTDKAKLTPVEFSARARRVAGVTAKNVEALAGAGELNNASKLIGRLLEFDNSAETRAKIQSHLVRAGHPELLPTPQPVD